MALSRKVNGAIFQQALQHIENGEFFQIEHKQNIYQNRAIRSEK